jgi:hypothetical protein
MAIGVVICAVWIATSTVSTLVGTQIQGVADAGGTAQAKFDFATQWSLPKLESLRVIIPGLFGYRIREYTTPPPPALEFLMPFPGDRSGLPENMIDPAPAYWGKVGEDPHIARMESGDPDVRAETAASLQLPKEVIDAMRGNNKEERQSIIDQIKPQMQMRFSGNGEYAGVLTALFAIFAVVNCCRGQASPFSRKERLLAWFWGCAALFALVAAWGRFAPLYSLLFHFPAIDKIRNPIKFMHPFTVAWIILAGFGMEAFSRLYLQPAVKTTSAAKILEGKTGWQKLSGFDKKYLTVMLVALGGIIIGYLLYAGFRPDLAQYLTHQGFDPDAAGRIAAFSVSDVAWFVIITVISSALVISALFGAWGSMGVGLGWGALCVIMVFDMLRADVPWVRYFDVSKSYSMNEITKFLMDKPYEHRVTGRLSPNGGYDLPANQDFAAAIHWWLENDFPAHDIQSLEIDQAPRSPVMDNNYLAYLAAHSSVPGAQVVAAARMWKLTNTRYIFAAANVLPALNQVVEPGRDAFHIVKQFNFENKPGVTVRRDAGDIQPVMSSSGANALIEFSDALPRAKLYAHWLTPTNDDATLQALSNPDWNPDESVLVSKSTNGATLPASSTDAKADPGTVEITHYSAKDKDIQLHASAKTPAVLLYNDRTGTGWNVWVDGKPSELLRCNYIMRGVVVPVGEHTVEFKFTPSLVPLCVTLAALLFGAVLLFYVCWPRGRDMASPQPA